MENFALEPFALALEPVCFVWLEEFFALLDAAFDPVADFALVILLLLLVDAVAF
ncbi:MAG TPA: hypothetical protein VH413_01055 [Verrucomicrobiae bacterium]|nr:hypothetical protein [Verrucomicrobiae bacterium]